MRIAWLEEQWRRLILLLKREQLDNELNEEIALHRELRAQKLRSQGLPMADAEARAQRRMGNTLRLREQSREDWGWPWLESLGQDLLWAVRTTRKNGGFAAFAIISLAIGIGANTAIFSVLEGLLLRPLPYPNAERLTAMVRVLARESNTQISVSVSDILQWREGNQVFDRIEATSRSDMTALSGAGEPERVGMVAVTPGYFTLLGVMPILGRLPSNDLGKPRTLALSYEFWQRHFAGDRNVLGRSLFVDNQNWTVVGVLPPGFDLFEEGTADVYRVMPLRPGHLENQGWLLAVGLLKPGITVGQAQAYMNVVAGQMEEKSPKTNRGLGIKVQPLQEALFGRVRNFLYPLFATVGFVLLIACTNIANLLLSRAATRRKEFAVRASLGAGRFRLIRQMLIESVVLSFAGGVLGLALSWWGVKLFVALAPRGFPHAKTIPLDVGVLIFTLSISSLTGIAFGLAPALRASRVDFNDSLKDSARISSAGSRQHARSALVVLEVALALVLLVSAGLMMNTFLNLIRLDPGFNPALLHTMEVRLVGPRYFDLREFPNTGLDLVTPQVAAFWRQLLERLRELPETESAALVDWFPMSAPRESSGVGFQIAGRVGDPGKHFGTMFSAVSADYFRVMQIPLIRGRHFSEQDEEARPWVAIINEAMAHRFWPNQEQIGQVIVPDTGTREDRPREIVGVVGNVRQFQLGQIPYPEMYIPYPQQPQHCTAPQTESRLHLSAVIRARSAQGNQVMDVMRRAARDLDSEAPIFGLKTVQDTVSGSAAIPRFLAQILGAFALVAVLLAAIGIYGVTSYSVNERSHEIGLRLALGAQTGEVLRLLLKSGLVVAGTGVVLGLAGSFATTPLLRRFLYAEIPHDPITIVLVTLFVIAITILATYIPARRALEVDPVITLRHG